MGINLRQGLAAIGVATVLVSGVAACNNDDNANAPSGGTGVSVDDGFKIGLLLPESKTTRYETFDRPLIEAKLKELCAEVQGALPERRPGRGEAAVAGRGDADPGRQGHDPRPGRRASRGRRIVANAKGQNVPVVAYDRLATGPIATTSRSTTRRSARLQGQALLDALTQGRRPEARQDRHDQRLADRPERRRLQGGRALARSTAR